MAKRREIEQILRKTAIEYGYMEIATPIFEHVELFTLKSGSEIVDQMYIFKDKSDRELALRPELTASTMRMFLAEMERAPQPVKVSYFGNAFRYERPQKGRFREFWQFGAELIGANSPEAEAECVAVAVMALINAGLKNFKLRLGHLGILKGIFKETVMSESSQVNIMRLFDKGIKEELAFELDSLDELSAEQRELLKSIITTEVSTVNLESFEPQFMQYESSASAWRNLAEVAKLLKLFGVPVEKMEIDLTIARGLDYYTGLVFEIDVPELGAEKQVCGGGAYTLLELFGGKSAHTIGFAIGFDRLMLALEEQNRPFDLPKPVAYIIPVGREALTKAVEIATELRKNGIPSELELKGRGPSKCLKYAANLGANLAIILGSDELAEKKVTVKDLKTGQQTKIEMDNLLAEIRKSMD